MNTTMKCIKELQRKKAKGQKSVNVMGKRLDIDEAIGHLIDEEVAWKDYGDRRISCSVTEKSGKVSGSAQGSKR